MSNSQNNTNNLCLGSLQKHNKYSRTRTNCLIYDREKLKLKKNIWSNQVKGPFEDQNKFKQIHTMKNHQEKSI